LFPQTQIPLSHKRNVALCFVRTAEELVPSSVSQRPTENIL